MQMEVDERNRERAKKRRHKEVEGAELTPEEEAELADEVVVPPAALGIVTSVQEQIGDFKTHIPTISVLCNPGLRQRHWDKMSEIAGFNITPDTGTTLRKVLKLDIAEFMDQFEAISGAATKEHSLEKAMIKMKADWEPMFFNLSPYRDSGISILSSVDEIQAQLDDQIIRTQTMKGSPFIKPFEKEIKQWEEQLLRIQDTIDEWLKVQAQWLYLEPIFASPDIMQQMPEEGRLFTQVDRSFRDTMKHTAKNTGVLAATSLSGIDSIALSIIVDFFVDEFF